MTKEGLRGVFKLYSSLPIVKAGICFKQEAADVTDLKAVFPQKEKDT